MLNSSEKRVVFFASLLAVASAMAAGVAVHFHGLHLSSTVKAGKLADGSTLVVTQQVLKPWTPERFISGRPVDLAFNHDRSQLAVLNMKSVEIIDEKSGKLTTIHTATNSYCGIAYRPGQDEIWASEANRDGDAAIFVAELNGNEVIRKSRIQLPSQSLPAGIVFSNDGKTAYVALNGANAVAVMDASRRKIQRQIPVDLAPLFLKLSQ